MDKRLWSSRTISKVTVLLFIFVFSLKSCETSVWSSWSKCSTTCGAGFRSRVMSCDKSSSDDCIEGMYDVDYCAGKPCTIFRETSRSFKVHVWNTESNQKTPIQVSGHWSKWSPCSCTCGIGIQVRRRENHYKATVTPTYSLRACVGQTRECTKAYVALSDKRRYSSILKTKTALYKHLGLVALVIVGVASSVFFICMLAIFKLTKG